jgi:hypothetical protein
VISKPVYSAARSDVKSLGAMVKAGWSANFQPILIRRGITEKRCAQLLKEITIWSESEDSIVAFAECAVLGWKS